MAASKNGLGIGKSIHALAVSAVNIKTVGQQNTEAASQQFPTTNRTFPPPTPDEQAQYDAVNAYLDSLGPGCLYARPEYRRPSWMTANHLCDADDCVSTPKSSSENKDN